MTALSCSHFAWPTIHSNEAAAAVGMTVHAIELFAGMQEVTYAFRSGGLTAVALDIVANRRVCDLRTAAGFAF